MGMKKHVKFILAILTSFSMIVDYNKIYQVGISENNNFLIVSPSIGGIICLVIMTFYYKFGKKEYKANWLQILCSVFLGLMMIIGISFEKTNSLNMILKNGTCFILSIIGILGYSVFFLMTFNFLNYSIQKLKVKNIDFIKSHNNTIMEIFETRPFIISFIVIFVFWLIYIIAYYPGILTPDGSYQILQAFNIHTVYADWVVQLDPNVNITNHHPVLYTLFLGICVRVGQAVGNDNLGIFIATMIQTLAMVSILAYTIKYLKKIEIPVKIRGIILIIYCIVPMFPFYAITNVKDTIYTGLIILYIIQLYDYIKFYKNEKLPIKKVILWLFLILLIALFRNNGIYVVLLSFIFAVFYTKKNIKKLGVMLMIYIALYTSYTSIILPYFKISETSKREMLSVPFQQTARYVKNYGDELTDKEKNTIDKILGYENLGKRYDPELADPVKNKYNKYTTNEDLKDYFKIWFKGLIKHPMCYIESFINNTYGYFYPTNKNWYLYYSKLDIINEKGNINYTYNESTGTLREILLTYGKSFKNIPAIGLISNIGFNTWLILIYSIYFIVKKEKRKYLVVLLPHIVTLLFCLLSPVNNYFRYAMPYIFAMPFTAVICLKEIIIKDEKE